jgi:hypothetical protein
MVPRKLEIITRLEIGKNRSVALAAYNIVSTTYDTKEQKNYL